MKFKSVNEAILFAKSIGATHYRNHGSNYTLIRKSGQIHPVIPFQLIDEYMALKTPEQRIVALASQYHCKADLVWFEKHSHWFAVICDSSMSGLLSDDIGVKKIDKD